MINVLAVLVTLALLYLGNSPSSFKPVPKSDVLAPITVQVDALDAEAQESEASAEEFE